VCKRKPSTRVAVICAIRPAVLSFNWRPTLTVDADEQVIRADGGPAQEVAFLVDDGVGAAVERA